MLRKLPNLHIICVAAAVAAALIYGAWRWREGRAQNEALQKCLEHMGQLLTEEGLRSSEKDSDVRLSAWSQTLTVLQVLGPNRKQTLLRYLYESHLIGKDNSIVSLAGADLREAKLSEADLSEATKLRGADLREADQREADLIGVILQEVNLNAADLREADLRGAKVTQEQLTACKLQGATMADGSKHN